MLRFCWCFGTPISVEYQNNIFSLVLPQSGRGQHWLRNSCKGAIPKTQEPIAPLDAPVCSPWQSSRPHTGHQQSQKSVADIQLSEILPDRNVQSCLVRNWAVIVSKVVTKYLDPFKPFQGLVVRHIPHKYSKEMSQKSDSVSLFEP